MKKTVPILAACSLAKFALAGPQTVVTPAPAMPDNPLSFLDGRVVFDVQDRVRWEIRENDYDFDRGSRALTDDNWLLNRFRLGVTIKPTSWLKIYAQGQDSREYLSDRPDIPGVLGAEGDDTFDLRQGYVEISNYDECPWGLKVGRQILSYGDERLVGSSDWNNFGRTFDAVKLRYQRSNWSIEAFASTVPSIIKGQYNQSDLFNGTENDRGQVFSGVYFTTAALAFQTTDLYVYHLHENDNPLYQPTAPGDTNFFTFGFRVKSTPGYFHREEVAETDGKTVADGKSANDGKSAPPPPAPRPLGFDYNAEAAFQSGKVRGLDLTAFAVHGALGYTLDLPWTPRIGVEYNFASGDHNATDGNIETFQNLFPSNHPFYGFMDAFSWQNIHNPEISLKATPCKKITLETDYHFFWLASNEDVWYRANGVTAVRPLTQAARDASTFAGMEWDFMVSYKPIKQLTLMAGYSHFFAGDYLKNTGPGSDADFGYLQATIEF